MKSEMTKTMSSELSILKKALAKYIADLIDLLIGVCLKEVGLLESHTKQLESDKRLTGSKAQIFKQLKGA